MMEMICFYCTSFLSRWHVVHTIPNIIQMYCNYDYTTGWYILWIPVWMPQVLTLPATTVMKTNNRMSLKWPFGEVRCMVVGCNVKRDFFFSVNRRVALEIFYIFVCIVLLWSLAYLACQCMCFLHEANVAVDFSFSSLSLCDIVYWEKKNVNKFLFCFWFQKRILWYCLILPFVMTLCPHTDSWKALTFILYLILF